LGAGGYLGYPAYQDWQANRAVALAKSSLESGDIRSAVLSLQAALRRRPEHLEARRVAASLLEASGSAEALLHRGKIMEAQPDSLEPKLEFARCAINLNRLEEAERVLGSIRENDRKSPEFLALQADLFLMEGQADRSMRHIASSSDFIRKTVRRLKQGWPASSWAQIPNRSGLLPEQNSKRSLPMENMLRWRCVR
jgi:uncharacterized protein HemY